MNRPDLEEFANLWTEPVESEQAEFDALARKARRRGRWLAHADLLMAVLLVGGSVFAAFGIRDALGAAALIILLVGTVWLSLKRRKIRQMARTLKTESREAFLESSVRIARANLRRVTLSMAILPFAVLLALIVKSSHRSGGDSHQVLLYLLNWTSSPRGVITFIVIAALIVFTARSRRRTKAELRRLEEVRRDYEDEAALDDIPQD